MYEFSIGNSVRKVAVTSSVQLYPSGFMGAFWHSMKKDETDWDSTAIEPIPHVAALQ